jgi:hypothetical protein
MVLVCDRSRKSHSCLLLWACRLRGKCTMCPNTAWLLFLLFAFGLVFLVALSVYLSRKRLNLAVLGIGVVGCRIGVVDHCKAC